MNGQKPSGDKSRNRRKITSQILDDVTRTREGLKLHHKIIYTSCIFTGVVLVWFGLWGVVSAIPFLNRPMIALPVGVGLLVFTGSFFKELG